jgi:DNA-binding transcriptional MerR regulator
VSASLDERLKIGDLARLTGKTVRALHLYEELELLKPAERTPGGFRLYDRSNLERIQFIDRLQRLGLSLTDIGDLLKEWNGSETPPAAMRRLETFYRAKLEDTRRQLVELRALEHELLASLAFLEGCRPCDAHDHPKAACGGCARPQAMDTTKLITGIAQQ